MCKGLTYIENSELMKIEEFKDQFKTLHLSALLIEWEIEKLIIDSGYQTIEVLDSYTQKLMILYTLSFFRILYDLS